MYCFDRNVLFLFLRKFFQGFQFSFRFQSDTQFLPTSFQCLLLRAVRSLLLIRSLTDATKTLYKYGAAHQCVLPKPNRTVNKNSIRKQLAFLLNSGFFAEKKFIENIFYFPEHWNFTAVEKKFSIRTTCVLELGCSVKKF